MVLGGYFPYQGTEEEVLEQAYWGEVEFEHDLWDDISDDAKSFIKFLLDPDASSRPTAENALCHPWLRTYTNSTRVKTPSFTKVATEAFTSIQGFCPDSKLKQAVCSFIASQILSKTDKQQTARVFRALDKNCDGHLDRAEVKEGFKEYFNIDISSTDLDLIFSRVDVDCNDKIEYSEFLVASMWQHKLLDEKTLQAVFDLFDTDKSGEVDVEKVKIALGMGQDWDDYVTANIIKDVATDGDDSFTFMEFSESMSSIRSSFYVLQDSTSSRLSISTLISTTSLAEEEMVEPPVAASDKPGDCKNKVF